MEQENSKYASIFLPDENLFVPCFIACFLVSPRKWLIVEFNYAILLWIWASGRQPQLYWSLCYTEVSKWYEIARICFENARPIDTVNILFTSMSVSSSKTQRLAFRMPSDQVLTFAMATVTGHWFTGNR